MKLQTGLPTDSGNWCFRRTEDEVVSSPTQRDETAIERFQFTGLRNTTTEDQVEAYFNLLGPVLDLEIRTNKKKGSLHSSKRIVTWLSSTLVHTLDGSKCIFYKKESLKDWYRLTDCIDLIHLVMLKLYRDALVNCPLNDRCAKHYSGVYPAHW